MVKGFREVRFRVSRTSLREGKVKEQGEEGAGREGGGEKLGGSAFRSRSLTQCGYMPAFLSEPFATENICQSCPPGHPSTWPYVHTPAHPAAPQPGHTCTHLHTHPSLNLAIRAHTCLPSRPST